MNNSNETLLREVLEKAKQLSPIDRADLIERIFGTFESVDQAKIDQAWVSESEDRLKAYRSGEIDADPIDQVIHCRAESSPKPSRFSTTL